jgi:hypothetical protein
MLFGDKKFLRCLFDLDSSARFLFPFGFSVSFFCFVSVSDLPLRI